MPLPPLAAANREQVVTGKFQVWVGDGASCGGGGQLGEPLVSVQAGAARGGGSTLGCAEAIWNGNKCTVILPSLLQEVTSRCSPRAGVQAQLLLAWAEQLSTSQVPFL